MEDKELGQLVCKEYVWFIKNYIGKHRDILSRFKSREAYEYIPLSIETITKYKKWFISLEITEHEPFVKFDVNDGEAVLILSEEDIFDYTNSDYQLGNYVGEYIVAVHLPTLSVDALQSEKVISVNSEEFREYNRLYEDWYQNHNSKDDDGQRWVAYRKYHHSLATKYLKPSLELLVPKFYPKDMEMFKKGLKSAIWGCDFSWYEVPEEFFRQTMYGSWCSEIILKLDIEK